MGFLARWLPEVVGIIRMIPAVRNYFTVARRQTRTRLIADLAFDAVALVAHQDGLDPAQAAQLQGLIDELATTLIVQQLVTSGDARAIAARAAAGAAAKIRSREALVGK